MMGLLLFLFLVVGQSHWWGHSCARCWGPAVYPASRRCRSRPQMAHFPPLYWCRLHRLRSCLRHHCVEVLREEEDVDPHNARHRCALVSYGDGLSDTSFPDTAISSTPRSKCFQAVHLVRYVVAAAYLCLCLQRLSVVCPHRIRQLCVERLWIQAK